MAAMARQPDSAQLSAMGAWGGPPSPLASAAATARCCPRRPAKQKRGNFLNDTSWPISCCLTFMPEQFTRGGARPARACHRRGGRGAAVALPSTPEPEGGKDGPLRNARRGSAR